MTILLCWVVGILFAISIYLILSRQLMQWLFGVILLSSTTNLLIFVAGRLKEVQPAFVSKHSLLFVQDVSNPLTQALILTAIVISFGLLTFMLVLMRKIWHRFQTLDSDQLRLAEPSTVLTHYQKNTHS